MVLASETPVVYLSSYLIVLGLTSSLRLLTLDVVLLYLFFFTVFRSLYYLNKKVFIILS